MSRTYIRTLADASRKGLVLRVRCWHCKRESWLGAGDLIQRGLSAQMDIPDLEPRLRCKGGRGMIGCGERGAEVRAMWPHEISGLPKGVPVLPFLNGDDRERKRLVRVARG